MLALSVAAMEPGDIFAEMKLILEARERIEQLAREGLEHQRAGRMDEARKALERAEEIERQLAELTAKTKRS